MKKIIAVVLMMTLIMGSLSIASAAEMDAEKKIDTITIGEYEYYSKVIKETKDILIIESSDNDGNEFITTHDKINNIITLKDKNSLSRSATNISIDLNEYENSGSTSTRGSTYSTASFFGTYVYFMENRNTKIYYELTVPNRATLYTPDVSGTDYTKMKIRDKASYFKNQLETGRTFTSRVGEAVFGSLPAVGELQTIGSVIEVFSQSHDDIVTSVEITTFISLLQTATGKAASSFYSATDVIASGSVSVANFYNCRTVLPIIEDLVAQL